MQIKDLLTNRVNLKIELKYLNIRQKNFLSI